MLTSKSGHSSGWHCRRPTVLIDTFIRLIPPLCRCTAPSSPEEQKVGTKLSKHSSVTASTTNGQTITTTRAVDGSLNNFPSTEGMSHLNSTLRISSPSVVGISSGSGRTDSRLSQLEGDEADPDVIPNQYGEWKYIQCIRLVFPKNWDRLF